MSQIQLGFSKDGAVVFKNTQMSFNSNISRVFDLDKMFSFTVKLNKNKPNSFQNTYDRKISGNLKNSKIGINIPFIERNQELTFPYENSGEESVSVYECENGDFFAVYKEDFSKKYVKKYEMNIAFSTMSVLRKVGKAYKLGTKEVFSVSEVEDFFSKSVRNKDY